MKCQACEEGFHYLCGMQTWCECDCDGIYETGSPSPDDDMPHTLTCTCEDCLQNHPERDILYGDGNYFNWDNDEEEEES